MTEFEPIDGGLTDEYRQELLEDKIIPAAVAVIKFTPIEDHFLAVYSKSKNELAGLPYFDMVFNLSTEFCEKRLNKRFGVSNLIDPKLHELQSSESPEIIKQINPQFPEGRRRIYFPFTAFAETLPVPDPRDRSVLVPANKDDIMESIATDSGGDTLFQMLDMHRELLFTSIKNLSNNR